MKKFRFYYNAGFSVFTTIAFHCFADCNKWYYCAFFVIVFVSWLIYGCVNDERVEKLYKRIERLEKEKQNDRARKID